MSCRYLDLMKGIDRVEKVPGFPDQEHELGSQLIELMTEI